MLPASIISSSPGTQNAAAIANDTERLEKLFELYTKMTAAQSNTTTKNVVPTKKKGKAKA